ncbi:tyrosine-type recombinase/integrase [Sphingomonas sp. ABOLE]|uniref:tyrosine-type recombinase/integrase n=1 Tax=Sphingomonas sp. ABOLE TaxID=1985878 RepID=UPI001F49A8D8|nr:tyrosine-type recombinase/integrase [Sphingomonas sp. ABOLE]
MTDPFWHLKGTGFDTDEPTVVRETSSPAAAFAPGLAGHDSARVHAYVERASAEATLRAYRSDWRLFCAWCAENGYRPLPASPAIVAAFLTLLADEGFVPRQAPSTKAGRVISQRGPRPLGRATIGRRLAAIVFAHRAANALPPTAHPDAARLERVMRGIRKAKKDERPAKKHAADSDVMRDMLRSVAGESLRAYRDRALLAIGMAGAFRRSELVAVTTDHVTADSRGLLVRIRSSKTDQEGRGQSVAIPDGQRLEPVRHYRAWIEMAGISEGPVFRKLTPQGRVTAKAMSAQGVALVVKAAAAAAGYSSNSFSAHSLRAGFLTEAGRQNANLFKMKEHSRHSSLEMVAEYVRDHDRFRQHAGEGFL